MHANPNILLIRLKSIGDILFTLPAVHMIRSAFPDGRISFLVSKELAPLLQGFREVDEVATLNRNRLRGFNPVGIIHELGSIFWRLRRGRFSLVVDFQGYGETALLTRWTGARDRWGVVYRPTRRWAYSVGVPRDPLMHPAEAHLEFLRQCSLPPVALRNEFCLPAEALAQAQQFFSGYRLDLERPTLFIQPFTSKRHKDWPIENYLAAARSWRQRGLQVLFGGGPGDRAALEPVRQAGFPVSAGVPLLVTGGLMRLSRVVVSGDTGLGHLAVALGRRVVMIMGLAWPGSCHPLGHPDWRLAPPSGQTLAGLAPERLDEAVAAALRSG